MAVSDPDRSDRVVPIAPPPLVTLTAEARRGLLAPRRQPRPVYPPMSFSKWWRSLGWRHLVLVVAVLFTLYPLAWMASASINPVDTLSGASLIPEGASFDNYQQILDNPPGSPFMTWLASSWKIALIVSLVNVLLGAMAAYAFSRFRFTGRRVGLLAMLLVQVFPQFLAFVAIFLMLDQIGEVFPAFGLDTHIGLILVYLGGAIGFNTFLIKGFMDSVPLSLDESAWSTEPPRRRSSGGSSCRWSALPSR